jgi:hypothetical protein
LSNIELGWDAPSSFNTLSAVAVNRQVAQHWCGVMHLTRSMYIGQTRAMGAVHAVSRGVWHYGKLKLRHIGVHFPMYTGFGFCGHGVCLHARSSNYGGDARTDHCPTSQHTPSNTRSSRAALPSCTHDVHKLCTHHATTRAPWMLQSNIKRTCRAPAFTNTQWPLVL